MEKLKHTPEEQLRAPLTAHQQIAEESRGFLGNLLARWRGKGAKGTSAKSADLKVYSPDTEKTHHLMVPLELLQKVDAIQYAPTRIENAAHTDNTPTQKQTRNALENTMNECTEMLADLEQWRSKGADVEELMEGLRETMTWCEAQSNELSAAEQYKRFDARSRELENIVQSLGTGDVRIRKILDEIAYIANACRILWDESIARAGTVKNEQRTGESPQEARERASVKRMQIVSPIWEARSVIGKRLNNMLIAIKEKHFDVENNRLLPAYRLLVKRLHEVEKVCHAFYKAQSA